MDTVSSSDGATIAFDRLGDGPAILCQGQDDSGDNLGADPMTSPAEPAPARPARGDSRVSGWPISVGRQTSGAETGGIAMTIADKAVLVTGANRGIGQALVEEALRRGAKRVYAGTRQPLTHPDPLVTPVTLDVTNAAQTQAAAEQVESLDILINNAGLALYDDLSDPAALERSLAINLFGTYGVTQAFLPLLTGSRGAIVNILSVAAWAPIPVMPAYSISKAAAFSLTQSLRALLTGRGVRVHAVLAGPVDTEMVRDLDVPKTSPEPVARAIFDGVENGEEEIFPDPMSASMAESWRSGAAKALERQNAALLAAAPVKS
jgi:NAD(P)-dependent dehydrogenase (short-subunit alcohol dehydrogenase family)